MDATVTRGDSTRAGLDAVPNAADPMLLGGSRIDGAIHLAAGHRSVGLRRRRGEPTPGEAVATSGLALPARWVMHAVWAGLAGR